MGQRKWKHIWMVCWILFSDQDSPQKTELSWFTVYGLVGTPDSQFFWWHFNISQSVTFYSTYKTWINMFSWLRKLQPNRTYKQTLIWTNRNNSGSSAFPVMMVVVSDMTSQHTLSTAPGNVQAVWALNKSSRMLPPSLSGFHLATFKWQRIDSKWCFIDRLSPCWILMCPSSLHLFKCVSLNALICSFLD